MKRLPRNPRCLLGGALLALAQTCPAQQDPLYSQYMFNTLAFNPGYAGTPGVLTVMALSRHQWVGFEGAPATQTLLAHSPLKGANMSTGFSLINDRIGPSRQTAMYGDFAYRIRTTEDTRLSFGIRGGLNVYRADLAALSTVQDDPANADIRGKVLPNLGFGMFWHGERYYAGLSVPKLLRNEIGAMSGTPLVTGSEEHHWFLIGGYVLDVDRDVRFKPSFMLRSVKGAPPSLDLNANFLLRDKVWLGAMYRVGNSFGVLGQYQLSDQLRAGYAFDLTTTRIGAYNAGTHEIMVNYDLRFIKGNTVSPRHFF